MYSLVLATMLTTGSAAPAHGWHSSCYGCYGCYGCCGGCYGCYGCCGGCYGCYGCCGGCYGCYGCYGSCHGCWGSSVVYYYPVYSSCYGCCGTVVPAPGAAPAKPAKPKEKLPPPSKEASAGHAATVVIAAPADVHVTVNGMPVALSATEQAFITPELEPDTNYSYMVKAQTVRDGQTVVKSRKVRLRAGEEVRVDFSELAAVPAESGPVVNRD